MATPVAVPSGEQLVLTADDVDQAVTGLLTNGLAASTPSRETVPAGFTRVVAFRAGLTFSDEIDAANNSSAFGALLGFADRQRERVSGWQYPARADRRTHAAGVLAALIATVAPLSLLGTTPGLAVLTRFNPEKEN
jgi:hypothetical protein